MSFKGLKKYIKTIVLFLFFILFFILYYIDKITSPEILGVLIGSATFIYEIDKSRQDSISDEEELIKKKLSTFFIELLFKDLCKDIPLLTDLVIEKSKEKNLTELEKQLEFLRRSIIDLNPKLSFYNLIGLDKEVKELNNVIIEVDERVVLIKMNLSQLIINESNMTDEINKLEKSIRALYEKILKLYL